MDCARLTLLVAEVKTAKLLACSPLKLKPKPLRVLLRRELLERTLQRELWGDFHHGFLV